MHLGLFRNRMKLDAKQGELVQLMRKLVPRSHAGIFLNERKKSTPLGALHSVYVHLGWFHNCMKLGAKRCELVQLMQKFVPQSHVRIFLNEST